MYQEYSGVSCGVDGYGLRADVCGKWVHEVEDVSVGSRRVALDEREKEPDRTQIWSSDLDLLKRPLDQMQVIREPMQENVKGYRRQWRGEAMGARVSQWLRSPCQASAYRLIRCPVACTLY